MKWSDKYATGVERIDDDHKMIFKMSEDFRAALDEGSGDAIYSTALEILRQYCHGHFDFEEQCMNRYRCPAAEKNKKAHEYFLETLSGFQQRYAANGFDDTEAWRLVDTVDKWLDNHICHIDVHLKRCVTRP